MALYDKLFEAHPVAIGKSISKMERWARVVAQVRLKWVRLLGEACRSGLCTRIAGCWGHRIGRYFVSLCLCLSCFFIFTQSVQQAQHHKEQQEKKNFLAQQNLIEPEREGGRQATSPSRPLQHSSSVSLFLSISLSLLPPSVPAPPCVPLCLLSLMAVGNINTTNQRRKGRDRANRELDPRVRRDNLQDASPGAAQGQDQLRLARGGQLRPGRGDAGGGGNVLRHWQRDGEAGEVAVLLCTASYR